MFNKNLKYYRLKKKMTKKQLADKCNITPMAITNYENGSRTPNIKIINDLAKALDIYVADFLQTRNDNLEFKHYSFRKNSNLSLSQQEFVCQAVEEYFSRFFDTVECLGGNPLPKQIEIHKLVLDKDYQSNAIKLRQYLSLPTNGPIESLVNLLENIGIFVLEINNDNEGFYGMNGTVNNYPYIVINSKMRTERKRTTIAHELARIMFDYKNKTIKEEERIIAEIAGAFLITNEDLYKELGYKKTKLTNDLTLVCDKYGISMYLLINRARQVNIISETIAKDFYIYANKTNYKNKEENRVKTNEEPLLFKQLVLRAINEEGISITKGAELLNVSTNELSHYCGELQF